MNSIAHPRRLASAVIAGCSVLVAGLFVAPAAAQPQPASQQPADALKAAFDALPDVERRAIQDALVWTGDYKGTIDGVLGRGGREALAAYARRANTTPEGLLADARRKQLASEAQKLRAAARFAPVHDARSGATIAFPASVFTRRADAPAGVRWSNAANSAMLETFRETADLPALYERLRAQAPGRKVTYGVLRADFLVVAGEDQRGVFYTRAAMADVNGKPLVRGYTLVYARALQPSFDTFSIAISNGFQPFAAPPAAAQAAGPGAPASATAAPPRRALEATAIALASGRALTAMSRDCPDMQVAGRPAKVLRRDAATGLALLEAQGLRAALARLAPRGPAGDADVFVLFAAQGAGVSLASGRTLPGAAPDAPVRVSAAVQDGVGGALLADRGGAWSGVLAQPAREPRRVAGVIPQAAWRVIPADAVAAFLGASGVKLEAASASGDRSAGEVASAVAAALHPVTCQR